MRQAGGGRRASMVSLLIGLCVFASTDLFEFVCADWANRLVPRATACSPTSSEQLPQYVAAAGNAPAFDKGGSVDRRLLRCHPLLVALRNPINIER